MSVKQIRYFIKTFGCQQNKADSERIEKALRSRGMKKTDSYIEADYIVINTCMVRHSAENRVYGFVNKLEGLKARRQTKRKTPLKIVVTGCMVGISIRDKTGKYLRRLKNIMPYVDEFLPIEEIGFGYSPIRVNKTEAWVPISNGCNNYCTYCVVPFTRGREVSRPYEEIIAECKRLKEKGYKKMTLLGQNVNSYGADLIVGRKNIQVLRNTLDKQYFSEKTRGTMLKYRDKYQLVKKAVKPIYVKHLGRLRIPTLFPHLLRDVSKLGFENVNFISSNPWDFSDELIEVVSKNNNITRTIHLPVQSGDDGVLRRMNRWYGANQYLRLVNKLRAKIPNVVFTTDIIVGFCGETEKEFENTVLLCKKVGFSKAYIAMYSPRPMTSALKIMNDDIKYSVKKRRWLTLEKLINQSG